MSVDQSPRLLLLPGWRNSDPGHWQSRWEAAHACRRVEQDDWEWPRRGDWMARLEEVLLEQTQPATLIAHSLGCHLVAAWAAHSRHTSLVHSALLVAIPDVERADMPPNLYSWRPVARQRLAFPTLAVISTDDPYCDGERAHEMARAWGSETFEIGAHGHVNGESGLDDWPQGWSLLQARLG